MIVWFPLNIELAHISQSGSNINNSSVNDTKRCLLKRTTWGNHQIANKIRRRVSTLADLSVEVMGGLMAHLYAHPDGLFLKIAKGLEQIDFNNSCLAFT